MGLLRLSKSLRKLPRTLFKVAVMEFSPVQAGLTSTGGGALDALAGVNGKIAYLAGAGGCGMRGAAQWLISEGWEVWGADSAGWNSEDPLVVAGMKVPSSENPFPPVSMAIRSAAVPSEDAGFQLALSSGAHAYSFPEFLGAVSHHRRFVAIAGSHGKTTVAAWIAYGLHRVGQDVGWLVGAEVPQLPGSSCWGAPGSPLIVESCEYDRSFLNLTPDQAVLLNVDAEHPDTYPGGLPEVQEAFEGFLATLPKTGKVFAGPEAPNLSESTRAVWQSVPPLDPGVPIGLAGIHNRRNGAVVAAVLADFGLQPREIQNALASFRGASRRMEIVGEWEGALIVSDYAHHPREVEATLQATREAWPEKRLVVVFQPHQAQRLHAYREQFAPSLDVADALLLLEVHRVRDPDEFQASVEELLPALEERFPGRPLAGPVEAIHVPRRLRELLTSDCIVLFLGAGDVDAIARELV